MKNLTIFYGASAFTKYSYLQRCLACIRIVCGFAFHMWSIAASFLATAYFLIAHNFNQMLFGVSVYFWKFMLGMHLWAIKLQLF